MTYKQVAELFRSLRSLLGMNSHQILELRQLLEQIMVINESDLADYVAMEDDILNQRKGSWD
jgi:hypothetical protein